MFQFEKFQRFCCKGNLRYLLIEFLWNENFLHKNENKSSLKYLNAFWSLLEICREFSFSLPLWKLSIKGQKNSRTSFSFYHSVLGSFMFSHKIGKIFALKLLLKFMGFHRQSRFGLQEKNWKNKNWKKHFARFLFRHEEKGGKKKIIKTHLESAHCSVIENENIFSDSTQEIFPQYNDRYQDRWWTVKRINLVVMMMMDYATRRIMKTLLVITNNFPFTTFCFSPLGLISSSSRFNKWILT